MLGAAMKNKIIFSLLTTMLFAVGLAKAAEAFDLLATQSDKVSIAPAGDPCVPPE